MALSGGAWIAQFPTSIRLGDLVQPFRGNVSRLMESLQSGGASVRISATLRPPERAYLMHFAWRIFKENFDADRVPPMAGVEIEWAHPAAADTRLAVGAMVRGYGIVFRPALTSRHTEGRAVDMTITNHLNKSFVNSLGETAVISSEKDLHELGRGFGVVKLKSDPPHWSDDGR